MLCSICPRGWTQKPGRGRIKECSISISSFCMSPNLMKWSSWIAPQPCISKTLPRPHLSMPLPFVLRQILCLCGWGKYRHNLLPSCSLHSCTSYQCSFKASLIPYNEQRVDFQPHAPVWLGPRVMNRRWDGNGEEREKRLFWQMLKPFEPQTFISATAAPLLG